nr:orotate phosphoribosyltransferase [Rhodothalassium salexigens]
MEPGCVDTETVLDHFRRHDALLEGHFLLSSGKHSPVYLQCARVMAEPETAAILCHALAKKLRDNGVVVDMVVSPAMGGVVVGYEMGRQLGVPAIFAERVDGRLVLRRGFTIPKGARVLMVEDVVTTGLSSRECLDCIAAMGGQPVAAACLIDRSGGRAALGVDLVALATIDAPVYDADAVPEALAAIPAVKPGSRGLA